MQEIIIIGQGFADRMKQMVNDVNAELMFPGSVPRPAAPPPIDLNIPLLACPFCGGSAKQSERVSYGHGDCTCQVYVECLNCVAHGPTFGNYGQPTDEQRLMAIQAWNKNRVDRPAS